MPQLGIEAGVKPNIIIKYSHVHQTLYYIFRSKNIINRCIQ